MCLPNEGLNEWVSKAICGYGECVEDIDDIFQNTKRSILSIKGEKSFLWENFNFCFLSRFLRGLGGEVIVFAGGGFFVVLRKINGCNKISDWKGSNQDKRLARDTIYVGEAIEI